MTLPVLQYLVAFNNGPLDDPAAITTVATPAGTSGAKNVWTDITPWVMGYQRAGGREHELSQFEAATVSLDLNNQDGRFNPWNTSGPYTGLLTIRKPLRVQATVGGTTYVRFTGHVDAWPTLWADTVTHFAQVHATDAFRILNLADITTTGYQAQVLADGARSYWKLTEPVGATVALDSGVNGFNFGANTDMTFGGSGGLVASTDTSCLFVDSGVQDLDKVYPASTPPILSTSTGVTLECWFMSTYTGATAAFALSAGWFFGATPVSIELSWSPLPTSNAFDPNGPNAVLGSAQVFDGKWHHLVATGTSGGTITLYVDGVSQGSATAAWGSAPAPFTGGVTIQYDMATTAGGSLQEIAVYPSALSAAQVAKHYSLATFPQQSTDARIGAVLDAVAWSSGARTLDPGVSTVQAVTSSLVTTSSLSHMQACEATEGGALFIDGTGKVRFVNRHSFITNAVFATSQATFDDTTGIPWTPGPALALDDIDLYNEARGQRSGGAVQLTDDATSIGANGRSTWQPSGQLIGISDAEVLGMTQYVVNNRKTPKSRLQSIDVNLLGLTAAQQQTVLGLAMLYRITVNRAGVPGTPFSQVGLIEHISETATPDTWTVTFGLDVADTTAYWVLGTSKLGVNTALAY